MLHTAVNQKSRPPYVEFERRAEEDRQATIQQGHYVARDVDYAIIRAIGSKDAIEKPARVFFDDIRKKAARGQYNPEWVEFYEDVYEKWKAGQDLPVNGMHVKNWPAISPAERDMLIAARLYTVEDVAAATEEALQRVGMGARNLKQRAQAWVDSCHGGKGAEELALLREQTRNQDEKIKTLEQRIAEQNAQIERLMSKLVAESGEGEAETTAPPRGRRGAR